VLVVDLDPQFSASRWLGASRDGAAAVFGSGADLEAVAEASSTAGVDVIGSSADLDAAARERPARVNALRRAFVRAPERWQAVILDCLPSLDVLSVAALLAASEVAVPVDPSGLTPAALSGLFDTLAEVRAQTGRLHVAGIVPVRVDERQRLARDVVTALREAHAVAVTAAVICERVAFREAATLGRTVLDLEPQGDAAADVRAVAAELQERNTMTKRRSATAAATRQLLAGAQ
jgi:chromosome partitioning protein